MPHAAAPHLRQPHLRGFTLVEILIAMAMMGILTAVALPLYTDYTKRGKLNEAFALLTTQSLRMEQYYQDNRTYANGPCGADNVPKYFTIACSGVPGTSDYTLKATANTGSGVEGAIFTLTRSGEKATLGMPAGWTVPTAKCWGTDKAGTCQ